MCEVEGSNVVDLGIDLSEFYMSVEWDILEVPAVRLGLSGRVRRLKSSLSEMRSFTRVVTSRT